jgi:tyrosyl-tRNA synthetase
MSVSDELMWRYFELLSFRPLSEIDTFKKRVAGGDNPRDIKFELAAEMVARFHDAGAAVAARESFINRFRNNEIPDDMPELVLECGETGELGVGHLLHQAGLVASTSEAFRMIKQGAVRLDGERVADRDLALPAGGTHVCQVGKRRFARVSLK